MRPHAYHSLPPAAPHPLKTMQTPIYAASTTEYYLPGGYMYYHHYRLQDLQDLQ